MKLTENIKNIFDTMQTLELLDDQEYCESQSLSPGDIELVKKELSDKISEHKDEVRSYIERKLSERREEIMISDGISEQLKKLTERKKAHDKKIEKTDKWIEYLLNVAGIEEMETPVAKIKFTNSESMAIEDLDFLPLDMRIYNVLRIMPEDVEDLEKKWYNVTVSRSGLPEIKTRYKGLSEDEKKELEGKIYIKKNRNLSIK